MNRWRNKQCFRLIVLSLFLGIFQVLIRGDHRGPKTLNQNRPLLNMPYRTLRTTSKRFQVTFRSGSRGAIGLIYEGFIL